MLYLPSRSLFGQGASTCPRPAEHMSFSPKPSMTASPVNGVLTKGRPDLGDHGSLTPVPDLVLIARRGRCGGGGGGHWPRYGSSRSPFGRRGRCTRRNRSSWPGGLCPPAAGHRTATCPSEEAEVSGAHPGHQRRRGPRAGDRGAGRRGGRLGPRGAGGGAHGRLQRGRSGSRPCALTRRRRLRVPRDRRPRRRAHLRHRRATCSCGDLGLCRRRSEHPPTSCCRGSTTA